MRIDPLAKVTLSVTFETEESNRQAASTQQLISFIYGIGLSGLTDFECALTGKADEDEIRLCLMPDSYPSFFGHLLPLFEPLLQNREEHFLTITLVSTEPADSTEVVKAMASIQQCGCGCDCGCH